MKDIKVEIKVWKSLLTTCHVNDISNFWCFNILGEFMDKITSLTREIEYWKNQSEEAKKLIEKAKQQCDLKYGEIAKAYQDFYTRKTNKEFVLCNDFPSLDALKMYSYRISNNFPLHEYGILNVKELAEIIKHLYQFKTGKEYQIFTIGTVELEGEPVYGGQVFSSKPHLYLMVGNNKALEPYGEYNGKFVNSNKLYLNIFLNARGRNIINIEADRDYHNSIGIECLTGHIFDESGLLNYYNECYQQYTTFKVSENKQIFSEYLQSSLNYSGGYKMKGIKDVMGFNIHPFDTYIAKVLISIIIYKRNNNIQELSNEDYNHIFGVLFGEKVDIVRDSKIDIPKRLIYIPNEKSGR